MYIVLYKHVIVIEFENYLCWSLVKISTSQIDYEYTSTYLFIFISRDGGKWWSKDHHLVVVKILKNVDFSLKNVKKW